MNANRSSNIFKQLLELGQPKSTPPSASSEGRYSMPNIARESTNMLAGYALICLYKTELCIGSTSNDVKPECPQSEHLSSGGSRVMILIIVLSGGDQVDGRKRTNLPKSN